MQAADVFFGGICFFWALLAPLAMLTGHQWRRPLLCAAGMLVIFAAWHASASLFLSAPHVLLSALAIVWDGRFRRLCRRQAVGKKRLSRRD